MRKTHAAMAALLIVGAFLSPHPLLPGLAALAMLVVCLATPEPFPSGEAAARHPGHFAPGAIYTVSGRLAGFQPAPDRPGCILELTDGKTTGYYYVPLSPHDVRIRYPGEAVVRLTLDGAVRPSGGVYDTIGNGDRLWDLS